MERLETAIKIDCYLSQGCGSEQDLKKNIAAALEKEDINTEVNFYRIDDVTAISLDVSGSPSVFINEKELQPLGKAGFS